MPAEKPVWVGVNPNVMKWARESIGLAIPEVSRRLNIGEGTVTEWEMGDRKPTLNTLKKLTSLYKRPLAVFFLPNPPKEPPLPTDYRALPEDKRRPLMLDREVFTTLEEAKVLIEEWRREYNQARSHSALNYRPPAPAAMLLTILTQ